MSPQNLAVLVEVYPIHQRVKAAVKYSSEQHTVRHKLRHLKIKSRRVKAAVKKSFEEHTVRHTNLDTCQYKAKGLKQLLNTAVRSIQSDTNSDTIQYKTEGLKQLLKTSVRIIQSDINSDT